MEQMYDIIIIGGGPAGITAAIYTSRQELQTLVITKEMGGQIVKTPDIENYPGFESISGPDLAMKFINQAEKFGAKIIYEEVKKIEDFENYFQVTTNTNQYHSRALILSFGKVPRKLKVPGESEFIGRGVSYCATCDAPFYRHQDVAVVGGGNSAFDAALMLSKIARQVYLIHRNDTFTAEKILIDKVQNLANVQLVTRAEIQAIQGDNKVRSLIYKQNSQEKELKISGVFIEIGYEVDASLIKDFIDLDENNQIIVNKDHSTSRKGVFAAGDLTNSYYKQIVISAAEGAIAGISAAKYVNSQKID